MAYSIKRDEIIDYPCDELYEFEIMAYEWIDNLNFTLRPEDCIKNADKYISIARTRFLESGWNGEGNIELMWIPPFMLKQDMQFSNTKGVVVWHVKQEEDGISWLLYPVDIF